jgi:hypothetical membrane protein
VTGRQAGVSGIVAIVVFWAALAGFSAAHPNYSHSTKAISELGVIGAPHALAWNILGFMVPGVLLAICGAGLARSIDRQTGLLWWTLVLSGAGFAGTGLIPAEMHNGSPLMTSSLTIGHALMSILSGIAWSMATFVLAGRVRHNPYWIGTTQVAWVLALAGLLGMCARMLPAFEVRPGLGQRVAFATYFCWYLVMSFYLVSAGHRRSGGQVVSTVSRSRASDV